MDRLRVVSQNIILSQQKNISASQQQDVDTLTIVNDEATAKLKQEKKYQAFEEWL
jgi:hypothetical protein